MDAPTDWRIIVSSKLPDDSGRFAAGDIIAINTFNGALLPDALRYAASWVNTEARFVAVMPVKG